MYAMVGTRLDIAFAVGTLGRHAANPNSLHLSMAKKAMCYLKGVPNLGLTYTTGEGTLTLSGYVDADWGGTEDRRSTTGFLFFVNNSLISWSSKRQQTVALSSTEAEYMAATQATKEALWLRQLLADLGHKQATATTIYEDNQSCILLAKNPVHHSRSKHIDIQWHFVREKIESEEVQLAACSSADQLADILTKAQPKSKFLESTNRLGLSLV